MDFAPQVWAKCDPELRQALEELPASSPLTLPVMVVLGSTAEPSPAPPPDAAGRARYAAARAEEFEVRVAGLVERLERVGGRDLRQYWIAGAVAGLLPATAIAAAAAAPEVLRLELIVRRRILL